MYKLFKALLFRLDPEQAHQITFHALSFFPSVVRLMTPPVRPSESMKQSLWGQEFAHPIGLAAGLDKNGIAIEGLLACGFSHVEVGTVTPRPQPGNPKPRLYRLVDDEALINRMGFNNHGATQLRRNLLKRRHHRGVVGVNIGKNKDTPNEEAIRDYLDVIDAVYTQADYICVNVSSPNTPGLRDLQQADTLVPLVQAVLQKRDQLFQASQTRVKPHRPPVFVKLAPDLADEDIREVARRLIDIGVDGFVATNTTIARPADLRSNHSMESGGLSGRPVKDRSTEVVRILYRLTQGRIPIIGCGGVFDADDAYQKILAGASLVQLYTGLIYKGPGVVREIVMGLEERLQRDGYANVHDAVGAENVVPTTLSR